MKASYDPDNNRLGYDPNIMFGQERYVIISMVTSLNRGRTCEGEGDEQEGFAYE